MPSNKKRKLNKNNHKFINKKNNEESLLHFIANEQLTIMDLPDNIMNNQYCNIKKALKTEGYTEEIYNLYKCHTNYNFFVSTFYLLYYK